MSTELDTRELDRIADALYDSSATLAAFLIGSPLIPSAEMRGGKCHVQPLHSA